MPSWFDILTFDTTTPREDSTGMLSSVDKFNRLIASESEFVPSERIVLGGFSQGGTISLLTGLTTQHKLGGVVILSGRAVLKEKLKEVSLRWL